MATTSSQESKPSLERTLYKKHGITTEDLSNIDTFNQKVKQVKQHEISLLNLLARVRFATGDNGKRMQEDFVKYCSRLRQDAELFNVLQEMIYDLRDISEGTNQPFMGEVLVRFLAARRPDQVPCNSGRLLPHEIDSDSLLKRHLQKLRKEPTKTK